MTLAGLEGMKYREQTLQLEPGDLLFLYTDGVTEATDARERMFGNEAPQFDDMTMLCLYYAGK